jgi:hypothetical protein
VRFTGIAQWTSKLFRNVLVIGSHPGHMTNAEKVDMPRCLHGGEFPVSGPQACLPKGRRRNGRVDMQDSVPAKILRRVPWLRGVYLDASGEGDVEGQAPGVIYNK